MASPLTDRSSLNPQPITVKGIKTFNPQILRIYNNKNGDPLNFIPVAAKTAGCALGTIFKKEPQKDPNRQWMGKVGEPKGTFRNDPQSVRTRSLKELNLDAIREKLAYDLFQELGRGRFKVPKSRLSLQPVKDPFNEDHGLAIAWVSQRITETLRIMSLYMDGYSDFAKALTQDEQEIISFMEYIKRYHRPPETLLTPEGKSVPLYGNIELLVVGRCLSDVDLYGGAGYNAGFIWLFNDQHEIIGAQAVKIDPGYSFCFKNDHPQDPCSNLVINTVKKLGPRIYHLQDVKNIQTSTGNDDTLIHWDCLLPQQKKTFLETLLNVERYLHSDNVLNLLFYRDGKFFHSETACLPQEIAQTMQQEMREWMNLQMEIYEEPLAEFKQQNPEQLLRIRYIDQFGEISLPMSHETYPIRELFVDLALVRQHKSKDLISFVESIDSHMERRSSLQQLEHDTSQQIISLDRLFEGNRGDCKTTEKS